MIRWAVLNVIRLFFAIPMELLHLPIVLLDVIMRRLLPNTPLRSFELFPHVHDEQR